MDRRISVLISTYQRHHQLRSCLKSISMQTIVDEIEVCIVNDGGDSIDELVREFPSLTIRHYNSPRNIGQVAARNIALSLAVGQWLAICDDDDRYTRSHLEQLYLAGTKQPESSDRFVYSDAELVCLEVDAGRIHMKESRLFAWQEAQGLLRKYNPIVPSSILYHRSIHERIGTFDEAMGHYWDWDFFLRAAASVDLIRVPQASLLYGIDARGGNQSANPFAMRDKLEALIAKHQLGELPSSNFWKMTEDECLNKMQAASQRVWDMNLNIWQ